MGSVAVVGGGRLGGSLIQGLLAAGSPPASLQVVEPAEPLRRAWSERGLVVHASSRTLEATEAVLLVVKPRDVPAAVDALNASPLRDTPLLSFCSGYTLEQLRRALRPDFQIGRVRANVLVASRNGNLLLCAPASLRPLCARLLGPLGELFELEEEQLVGHTWASSSLPLVVLPELLRRSLAQTAPDIDPDVSRRALLRGLRGLLAHLEQAPEDAARRLTELTAAVATPGGMNDAALGYLSEVGVWEGLAQAERVYRAREHGPAAGLRPVAVLTEGSSAQASVSLHSARHLQGILEDAGRAAFIVRVDRSPWTAEREGQRLRVDADLRLHHDTGLLSFEYAFVCVHTAEGKGPLQGQLERRGLPFDCAGLLSSALCDDKHLCKAVLAQHGIRVPSGLLLHRGEHLTAEQAEATVGLPCVVKPNRAGSSLGLSLVQSPEALPAALEAAFAHDSQVLVEERVCGTEYTVALARVGDEVRSYAILEYPFLAHGVLDHQTKWDPSLRERVLARSLSPEQEAQVRALCAQAARVLGVRGMARVDLILDPGGWCLLEINTLPGLTPESPYPMQVNQGGASFSELVLELLDAGSTDTGSPPPLT